MSKLDQLIEKLCPNGVEWKELGEVSTILIGEFVHKSKQSNDGEYPVYNGGITNTGFYEEFNREKNKVIISARGANAGFVNRVFTNFWSGNSCYTIVVDENLLNWNYLYHFLKKHENELMRIKQIGSIPAVSKKQVENLKIPIPPLEIQKEIVHILDSFTELTAELTAELKQYEHYRDSLLTFGDEVEKVKLKDIAMIKARIGWQGLTKDEYLTNGKYQLITGTNFVDGKVDFSKCYFVTEERYMQDKNIQVKEDDILVTKDGTLGKVAYISELIQPATLNSGIFVIRCRDERILNKYLFYYLNSPKLMNFARSKLTGGTIKHLNQNVIIEFPISLPPLSEQERIVSILDKFDSLCNDITKGLPAEIEAHKKQYEYYRDKLLTFKNISENK